jgi:serine/threonine protein kinase/Tol biopolymer transport system component
MTPERWQQVKHIFNAAIEQDPMFRPAFLAEACGADADLRSEVESLISSHEEGGSFIDSPAFEAAGLFAEETTELRPGQLLGSYEVVAPIGAGGMGEVYLAEDRRLGRKVAIKLLPASFTRSADRVRRFEREARAASALNHPNILTIFEVGQADGVHFIVTEFIEGETLRQRLRRERPGLTESLDIAIQIADALNAAHKAGIVHRDIKPENVMLRPDGYVKVLDFGLAKLTGATSANFALRNEEAEFVSPGTSARESEGINPKSKIQKPTSTGPGVIMGTVNYMSPEQTRGQETDARSDIWSLGVVIYECAAGREPFGGETPSDTLSLILQREPPPLARVLPGAPPELERIVSKALRKNREERYQVVKDLLLDLKSLKQELEFAAKLERSAPPDSSAAASATPHEARAGLATNLRTATTDENARAATTGEVKASPLARAFRRPSVKALAALAVLVVAALGFYKFVLPRLRPAHFEATRIAQITNNGKTIDSAISPDGKLVAYVLSDAGQQSLWVRQVSAANDVQIVAPARVGFWGMTFSPDSSSIYYGVKASDAGSLYRVPALGGTPVKLLDVIDSVITFSPDGKQIAYFTADTTRGESYLYVADADGKNARVLASRKMPEFFAPMFFTGPSWSPDGQLIACSVSALGKGSKVITVRVSDGAEQTITTKPHPFISRVLWLPDMTGLLMVARDREVFNVQIWHLSYPGGEERRVTSDLNNYRSVSVTSDGRQLATVYESNLMSVWVVPDGSAAGAAELPTGNVGWMGRAENIDFLPDGRIIYTSNQTGRPSVWLMNADGTGRRQLTPDQFAFDPAATPDGRYVLYTVGFAKTGKANLWRVGLDGSAAVRLTDGQVDRSPAVSPDGRWVVYSSLAGGRMTLWRVPVAGGTPEQITDRMAYEPQVSPDGKWIAYAYSDLPNVEILYNIPANKIAVIPFDGGEPVKVFDVKPGTTIEPTLRWSRDGNSLLYSVTQSAISNVWSQPLDGGPPRQVTDFKEKLITTFNVAPDGKLVCVRGVFPRDAAVITDAR